MYVQQRYTSPRDKGGWLLFEKYQIIIYAKIKTLFIPQMSAMWYGDTISGKSIKNFITKYIVKILCFCYYLRSS